MQAFRAVNADVLDGSSHVGSNPHDLRTNEGGEGTGCSPVRRTFFPFFLLNTVIVVVLELGGAQRFSLSRSSKRFTLAL